MDPRAPPPLGLAPHLSSSHLRPPEPPHRLLLRPTSFLEQQPSIKGEYIEDLEGIKFEPVEPPQSPEHVSRQQFLKQFPLISVRPPSPSPLPLPTLIPISQQPLRFPPGLFPGHQVHYIIDPIPLNYKCFLPDADSVERARPWTSPTPLPSSVPASLPSRPAGLARGQEKKPANDRTFKETQTRSSVQYSPEISVNQFANRPTETTSTRACHSSKPADQQVPKGPGQSPEISSCQISIEVAHLKVTCSKISRGCS